MIFYGQYGQDVLAKEFFKLKGVEKGYFVDVGAADGIRFSNTYLLENEGWEGICVEAHPDHFEFLKNNRKKSICYSVAVGDKDGVDTPINLNYSGSLTSLDFDLQEHFKQAYGPQKGNYYGDRDKEEINGFKNGKAIVKMRTIDSIISENKIHPHFICIDVDGSEKYAFKGLDLNLWKPELLLLEHTVVGHAFVDEYAARHSYIKARDLGSDSAYVLNEEDKDLVENINIRRFGPNAIGRPVVVDNPARIK